jgi:EAL domain-containing protein (putative c-di-GMP-specific phosphodiesterase class I)
LSCLCQFSVDILEIDRSFVAMIDASDGTPRGLIEPARTLGQEIVAEGVETERLRDERCEFAQGTCTRSGGSR